MAKLTPQPHIDIPITAPIDMQLGPPTELFVRCEQTFIVKIDEMLWPNWKPITAEEIHRAILMYRNPGSPHVKVEEIEE